MVQLSAKDNLKLYGRNNTEYTTGRELGRGGEGQVYDVLGQSGLVLKIYNELPPPERAAKLAHMAATATPEIDAYAAWPKDIVTDDTGATVGFVMKKLGGYVPLHMLFSPMDRKKMFPDKGYNFLAHVARNLATAFHKLHQAGIIVGDVNEGNVLINAAGMVAFIDCDSFQVQQGGNYFFCEVGVPRYTPPELLTAATFSNIVRTVNTDSFSMSVLLFQLLFLGRHPYAGRHTSAQDIDEETAIKRREFAYSLYNKQKKLQPPPDSLPITSLPPALVVLFHQAFEQDARPVPAEWVKALDGLLADMITCTEHRLHTYPSQLEECPWCRFRGKRGIVYFLDDNHLHAHQVLDNIEHFVNGFRIETLELKKWNGPLTFPFMAPAPVEPQYRRYRRHMRITETWLVILSLLMLLVSPYIAVVLIVCGTWWVFKLSPWTKRIKKELATRITYQKWMRNKLDAMIREHDSPADLAAYKKALQQLQDAVHHFTGLPREFDRQRTIMEEEVYNRQLRQYLATFSILEHDIPSFGGGRKAALIGSGIYTAADIGKLSQIKVPGIGPKNQQVLISWQRQVSSGFTYIPDAGMIAAGMQEVAARIAAIKVKHEDAIRREYRSFTHLKMNIQNRGAVLERQINDMAMKTFQADLDLMAFGKFAA